MNSRIDHEEEKVQAALALLQTNPHQTLAVVARKTRCSYKRLRGRLRGIPPSSTRGGHNKKLSIIEDNVLKDFLYMCYRLGHLPSIENVIAAANLILCAEGRSTTVSRRWTKAWISRQAEFIKTIRSTPLSSARRASHNRKDIEGHFSEFQRCRTKWGILNDDIYNFDETGC